MKESTRRVVASSKLLLAVCMLAARNNTPAAVTYLYGLPEPRAGFSVAHMRWPPSLMLTHAACRVCPSLSRQTQVVPEPSIIHAGQGWVADNCNWHERQAVGVAAGTPPGLRRTSSDSDSTPSSARGSEGCFMTQVRWGLAGGAG